LLIDAGELKRGDALQFDSRDARNRRRSKKT